MPAAKFLTLIYWAATLSTVAKAECLPFTEAPNHVGETRCITGKVLKIEEGNKVVHFLDFCEDHEKCPFTVVVFPSDLRFVGDIRELAGRIIEIHGPIKLYGGKAEIILRQPRQLTGEAAVIPPLPKNYDVSRKGRYSAGKFGYAHDSHTSKRKRSPRVKTEDESDPAGTQD